MRRSKLRDRCSSLTSLYQLVSPLEYALLNGEAHLAGNHLVDDQLEAGRLHDRQIGRLGAFQDGRAAVATVSGVFQLPQRLLQLEGEPHFSEAVCCRFERLARLGRPAALTLTFA